MAEPTPSGVVSFLFTDVEGSTQLWEADHQAMAASLRAHDSLMRSSVAKHDGHIFTTAGDSFAVAFASAQQAVTAALDAQFALADTDWPGPAIKVRMGIHTGTAEERDGDYFGPVLNRAARLEAAGHGGQVLLSAVTAELFSSNPLPDVTLDDLGIHKLRDLELPEHVFQIAHPDLASVETPIRTFSAPKSNLPTSLNSFVGRADELSMLGDLSSEHRLVTLAGPGGTGKTRLAVEFGLTAADDFADGVWLVELASLDDDAVFAACAEVLGARAGNGVLSTKQAVVRSVAAKQMLLVLDNCEHVAGTVGALVGDLLASAPGLRVIASSRVSLHVPGEAIMRIGPLATDTPTGSWESPSIQLFLDRARAVRPGFEPLSEELNAIAHICQRIDGIPLGIELAAARLRSLSPDQLADRLDESFRILRAGDGEARHATLAATIDSSHESLSAEEQSLFRRLSVFAGGFELEAAEAVCVGEDLDAFDVLDHVDALVDHSLIAAEHSGTRSTRFRVLEPIREYAEDKLAEAGEVDDTRSAHARFFRALVEDAGPAIRGPKQVEWDDRLRREEGNVRAMLSTLLERGMVEEYFQTCLQLQFHWQHRGLQVDAVEFIERGLDELQSSDVVIDSTVEARALAAAAMMATEVMHPRAVEFAKRAYERGMAKENPALHARLSIVLGSCLTHETGLTEYLGADDTIAGAEMLAAHPEEPWWEPEWDSAFWSQQIGAYLPPDHPDKATYEDQAIAHGRSTGDAAFTAYALMASRGRPEEMDARLAEAVELARSCGLRLVLGNSLMYRGGIRRLAGDPNTARGLLVEAVDVLAEIGAHQNASVGRAILAAACAQLSDPETAREVLSALTTNDPPAAITGHILAAATLTAIAENDSGAAQRFRGGAERHLASNFLTKSELDAAMEALTDHDDAHRLEGERWTWPEAIAAVGTWLTRGSPSAHSGA